MKCTICKKNIKGDGNSALPLSEDRCCNACYFEHVVPAKAYRYGVLIPAKGRAKPYEIKNIGVPLLETNSLQEAVKGYLRSVKVETVRDEVLLVDEDGVSNNKPMNTAATYLAQSSLCEGEYIAGDALLMQKYGEAFKYLKYETAKVRAELINGMTECF